MAIPGGAGIVGGRDGEGGEDGSSSDSGTADESEMEEDDVRMRGGRTRSGGRPRRAVTGVYLYGMTEKCGRCKWRSTRAMPQLGSVNKEDDGKKKIREKKFAVSG